MAVYRSSAAAGCGVKVAAVNIRIDAGAELPLFYDDYAIEC
jgi:hypothetical protein